jgi:glycosyltransferase involved in cell wall biosynthesis
VAPIESRAGGLQPVSGEAWAKSRVSVFAFTGGEMAIAARFRVRQYIPLLARQGVDIVELSSRLGSYPPERHWQRPAWLVGSLADRVPDILKGWAADVTLLQREMISTLYTFEGFTQRPRLVDVDDAIHLFRNGWAAKRLARSADLVVVGNDYLAEFWSKWNSMVEILPTAVDTNLYTVRPLPERRCIGWIGSFGNLRYLEIIAPALAEVVHRFPDVSIAVCSNRPPKLDGLPLNYVPWSIEAEDDFLASLTVGLMPLEDGPWERGKCSLKMLQYMAAGRPCVASPVGMNKDILAQSEIGLAASSEAEWVEAISTLLIDPLAAEQLGAAGRALAYSRYSVEALTPRLARVLRGLARL